MQSIKGIDKLKNKIIESDIVSFDIFDTLLLRNVLYPTDIFKVVELEYYKQTKTSIKFYDLRIKAEELARQNSNEEDILFDEIYYFIEKELGSVTSVVKKIEIELEKKFLIPNHDIKGLYEFARNLGKKIYIISDMYLPSEIMSELLELNGYRDYDQLFISGEVKRSKATGSLYTYIKQQEQINDASKWLHIGDNLQSDIIKAESHGIQTYYYKKLSEREKISHTHTLADSIIRAIQINHKYINQNQEYWYRFGVDIVSPIYIGLMNWLKGHIQVKDNIYFLARDGYIINKLYQILKERYPDLPEGKYLYASRRAYIYPHLLYSDQKTAIDTLMLYNSGLGQKLTLKEILGNVGLSTEFDETLLHKYNISTINEVVDEQTAINIKRFLADKWEDIREVFQQELQLLERYFDEVGLKNYQTLNIFDIGWSGSTHLALKKLITKPINGYYFGTTENIHPEVKGNSYGYVFHEGTPLKHRKFVIENVMMFELIFSAPEGSLINFCTDQEGNIIPNKKNVEKNDYVYECIQQFQQGAIDVFEEALKYYDYLNDISKEFSLDAIITFIQSHRVQDMLQFSKLSNSIGFGDSKDIKKYVSVYDFEDYLANRKIYNQFAQFNLWKNAIIIREEQGRYFSRVEIEKLYNIRSDSLRLKLVKYIKLSNKAIRNPKKTVIRLYRIIKTIVWK